MPPKVDFSKCKGAAECSQVCPVNVFDVVNDKAVVARPEDCIECKACESACPNSAIIL